MDSSVCLVISLQELPTLDHISFSMDFAVVAILRDTDTLELSNNFCPRKGWSYSHPHPVFLAYRNMYHVSVIHLLEMEERTC